ncbi:arylsulfatase [Thalassoroseus pseudoceratinae]|uniref:arylsulfatase n=1 Tax=Thalassoroseus pseudoceratinae TaxID=2713176 RepID=UPI00197FBD5F|nr:arylsulfatase [Thalassoroseus pseudoceratinae]
MFPWRERSQQRLTTNFRLGLMATSLFAATVISSVSLIEEAEAAEQQRQPNVVLIMTDDQGYGDLACHGNAQIKTPNLDQLHSESVRLTNYHVDPTCSPTRSALMTGRYSSRTGVWHTIMGRSMMAPDETTIAEVFAANGYRTACFGKWHLGDNYPLRPQDQGFQEVFIHGGGGVGQTPDYWGNDYFGDTYWENGKFRTAETEDKYCTDVWTDAAIEFIKSNRERPFFCYIPTNAAHGPFLVAKKYSEPYKQMGIPSPRAEFYGMITNIDENVGRLRKSLSELGLAENTIFIFTTDNGTAAGAQKGGFNAGMRGQKGSEYDGGHRVPFFVHYPNGQLAHGHDINHITAHIDVLPTLADLCDVPMPKNLKVDGKSLAPLLSRNTRSALWPARTLAVHSQRVEFPQKWRKAAVMTDRWRFVCDGKKRELFDMQNDPGQKTNVAKQNPEVFQKLSEHYEEWYKDISTRFDDYVRIGLGHDGAERVALTCHDWHTNNGPVPWHQNSILKGQKANGFWAVDVAKAGTYEITARMRPSYIDETPALNTQIMRVRCGDVEKTVATQPTDKEATLQIELPAGPARLQIWLGAEAKSPGPYFVEVDTALNE